MVDAELRSKVNEGEFSPVCVEGFYLPRHQAFGVPWEKHIDDIRNMEVREDDIFLCAYPKAGTHWLWEVCSMLRAGRAEHESRAKEHLMLEFSTLDKVRAQASPRVFNTHLPFSMLPVHNIRRAGAKVIHIYRNPKDTTVSFWHHFKQAPGTESYLTLTNHISLNFHPGYFFGTWVDFLKQMKDFMQNNTDIPIFNVSFEETKRSPVETVRRLSEFLGVGASGALCEGIAQACSFRNMKAVSGDKHIPEGSKVPLHLQIYRKGEVGSWKNELTVADSERIDQILEHDLKLLKDTFPVQFTQ